MPFPAFSAGFRHSTSFLIRTLDSKPPLLFQSKVKVFFSSATFSTSTATSKSSTASSTSNKDRTLTQAQFEEDMSKVKECLEREGEKGWDTMYKEKDTPWDAGAPAPALLDLIQEGTLPNGTALVPGCGRGYDVFALATSERFVVGCDISKTVIEACQKHAHPNTQFVVADFFDPHACPPGAPYDLVYDYTFFCALPPSQRTLWAQRMASLVRPGGTLVTLMFPIATHTDGPPFAVQPEHYRSVLNPHFCEIAVRRCRSFPAREGKELLGIWIRNG